MNLLSCKADYSSETVIIRAQWLVQVTGWLSEMFLSRQHYFLDLVWIRTCDPKNMEHTTFRCATQPLNYLYNILDKVSFNHKTLITKFDAFYRTVRCNYTFWGPLVSLNLQGLQLKQSKSCSWENHYAKTLVYWFITLCSNIVSRCLQSKHNKLFMTFVR